MVYQSWFIIFQEDRNWYDCRYDGKIIWIKNIVGVKDATGDLNRVNQTLEKIRKEFMTIMQWNLIKGEVLDKRHS